LRRQEQLEDLEVEGTTTVDEHPFFSNAIVPRLTYRCCPTPHLSYDPVWAQDCQNGYLEGRVYLDGSVLDGVDEVLARAGYGVVRLDEKGHRTDALYGALPGPRQSIDAAEIFAAVVALRHACGAITLISDSLVFVGGWRRGRRWCVAADRPNADTWLSFWSAAEEVGIGNIAVEKVKAHTSEAAVLKGEISKEDRYGNEWADHFAKQGANLHRAPQTVRDRVAQLRDDSRRLAG